MIFTSKQEYVKKDEKRRGTFFFVLHRIRTEIKMDGEGYGHKKSGGDGSNVFWLWRFGGVFSA
jgi:hypothetical protein